MRQIALAVGIVAGFAAHAAALTCTTGTLVQWPVAPATPVWEMCVLPPSQSSGTDGSGIEIRNAYYNGHQVFKRANNPVVSVNYVSGCGCYRDWMDEERPFQVYTTGHVAVTGGPAAFAVAAEPALTVCDTGGGGGDHGGFRGVAIENLADRLVLTSQLSAGWYRYLVKWTFFGDGKIEPRWGFGAVSNSCVANFNHRHQAYWRFDFDIDGAANDAIGSPSQAANVVTKEEMRVLSDKVLRPPHIVYDTVTHRGYQVVPGAESTDSPVGAYPAWGGPTWNGTTYPYEVADQFMLQYKETSGVPLEVDDGVGFSSSQCAVTSNFLNFMNNEMLNDNGDVVTWHRGGAWHAAGALNTCAVVGPELLPIGDWNVGP